MLNNELISSSNKELNTQNIQIIDISKVEEYLFIKLDNGQKILTNGKNLYDVSDYNNLLNLFYMGNRFCAVMEKGYTIYVIDLKNMEILFKDKNAAYVSKEDERTLHIIMKIDCGNNTIYDIETKKYLPKPDNYEFENSLGDNLYVFSEQNNSNTNFYDCKRCVVNADGKIILKDIKGWIEFSNNHLIIDKKNSLCVVKINNDSTLEMKTIEQNENIIAKPTYHNGNLIIIQKGVIKIYTPDFELVNEFYIEGLNEVISNEIVSDTLKLCLPYTMDGEQVNKHLFINLNTGKTISHLRIECYPYWEPTTYIGQNNFDSEKTDYFFYDTNFEKIINLSASSYESIEDNKECMFIIRTSDEKNEHKQLLNTENNSIRDIDYDYIYFHHLLPYGYGVNLKTQTIDFFDENLNVIIPNFDYKKFNLSYYHEEFSFFIINKYICIQEHHIDDYGKSRWRTIIQKADGEVVLDSFQHQCYAIGNIIQIIHNENSKFLNTITGEIGRLGVSAQLDETGKIDLKKISSANNILSIINTTPLELPSVEDNQKPKVKKLLSNQTK